jgi:hypothetical protein
LQKQKIGAKLHIKMHFFPEHACRSPGGVSLYRQRDDKSVVEEDTCEEEDTFEEQDSCEEEDACTSKGMARATRKRGGVRPSVRPRPCCMRATPFVHSVG